MKTLRAVVASALTVACLAAAEPLPAGLRNSEYAASINSGATVRLVHVASGAARDFSGRFRVLVCDRDPALTYTRSAAEVYVVPQWNRAGGGGRTHDLFDAAGEVIEVVPTGVTGRGGRITWQYAPTARFELSAFMEMPAGSGEPKLSFALQVHQPGWYSVGYAGAPEFVPAAIESIYQSRIWQEKRFPRLSFLSSERMCSLPAALVCTDGITTGVAADPQDGPFRIPTFTDSRFGLSIRNQKGSAQPQFFSPVLGNANAKVLAMDQGLGRRLGDAKVAASQPSRLEAGAHMASSLRLLVWPGDCNATFVHLARSLYGFADVRENVGGSLNQTIENMVAYALNDALAAWNSELKGSDYATDVPGTVKNVSALHPLSVALVSDNEDVFRRRALPMMEYLISREKYLFATDPAIKRQNPSAYLRGPAAEISELAALFEFSQERATVFRELAIANYGKPRARNLKMISGASWQDALAMFRMTGNRAHLEKALKGALDYVAARISTPQTDFSDVKIETGGQFWSDMAPKWIDLLELYEETHDARFLAAARAGAASYASYASFYPVVPDSTVRVNAGGAAGRYALQTRLFAHSEKMPASEQDIPAWQVTWNGLLPEAANTYPSNAAVFLAPHAAFFLRLAHYTGDAYFRDLARSAIVGRYLNYPGYAINGEFTNVYARPDYPLRPLSDLTYNNIYYPHIWPQIASLYDYLISDVFGRSQGRIDFPSRYAQGYAYLQTKVYGDRPGRFYDDENVRLWMPAQLVDTGDLQVNYVSALGTDHFYVVLLNESARPVKTVARLNAALLPLRRDHLYSARRWSDNGPAQPTQIPGTGVFEVEIAPHGLVALALEGITVQTQFQHKVLGGARHPLGPKSHVDLHPAWSPIHASILSFGDALTEAYVYLEATGRELQSVRIETAPAGKPAVVEDRSYPFEFSLPWPDGADELTLKVSAISAAGEKLAPAEITLKRN